MDVSTWWDQSSQRTMAYFFPAEHVHEALAALVHTQAGFRALEMTARVTYLELDPADTWMLPQSAHAGAWACVRVDIRTDGWLDWDWWSRWGRWLLLEDDNGLEGSSSEDDGGMWSKAFLQLEARWTHMKDVEVFPHLEYLFAFGYQHPDAHNMDYSTAAASGLFSSSNLGSSSSVFAWPWSRQQQQSQSYSQPYSPWTTYSSNSRYYDSEYGYATGYSWEQPSGHDDYQVVEDENDVLYGYPRAFQNRVLVEGLLTEEQRRGFLKYRQEQDPDAVFWGGHKSDLLLARLFREEYSGLTPAPKSWWRQLLDFVWMVIVS
jgi:hypothetical protein